MIAPAPVRAQIALPGATAPAPEGTVVTPRAAAPHRHRSEEGAQAPLAPVAVPSAASLAGHVVLLNGGKSQVTFEPHGSGIGVAHLTFVGETVADARQACKVEGPPTPLSLSAAGRPNGVERLALDFPACPLQFDVLDGAVLVDRTQGVCEFKENNCRVDPVGLWGPEAGEIGPDRVKAIERARAKAETAVRTTYKALAASTKDRVAIAGYARDQAQFSSTREELCRDYAGEGRHGFCSATLTQARAAFLRAKLDEALDAKAKRKQERAARHGGRS